MNDKRKDYITWDEYFMAVAKLAGMRSKALSEECYLVFGNYLLVKIF